MTIVCSYCKTPIGEKCGKCGSENVDPLIAFFAADVELWGCLACGHSWILGSEPASHEICPECIEVESLAIRAAAPAMGA